ncbi:MAG: RNA binding S1 domain protein [Candidatus Uhrbacteria bacterium GW2011_GWA2_52_8d]|uniref:RNA binding S1 domain protein n=1 Tax=Candidatus Uhrbacteria bacterium GW2011_GWA2_52_8d TaxID=1618979 RepID=A0A0G1XQF9_9BACT|nr:MAG: RNA binding S1 domain protein [Candidatus Uhrbacteria bacterium GW2011_GWA2_52_8d]
MTQQASEFETLIEEGPYLNLPQVGDVVTGTVIGMGRREVRIDLAGIATGVVRGKELFAESSEYTNIEPGTQVEATVMELENENGEIELSFRFAGQQRAWEDIRALCTTGETIETKILEANKGGLIVRVGTVNGFLPVSQLSPEHYPRVSGGDKNKILEKLKSYVGMKMKVHVIDANEVDEKLIVSEKTVWEDQQKNVLSQFKIGDVVEGEVTALADFGAFIKFGALEGLVHISEIAWQRIDHPRDLLKIEQHVKAEIIGIEGSKIFLSMKKLVHDPWENVSDRYKVGDVVEGTVLKVNPFGFFVELDSEIHGLAHVSELSDKPVTDVTEIGKEGERLKFKIVSIEPNEHRLGLSIKAISQPNEPAPEETSVSQEPGE